MDQLQSSGVLDPDVRSICVLQTRLPYPAYGPQTNFRILLLPEYGNENQQKGGSVPGASRPPFLLNL